MKMKTKITLLFLLFFMSLSVLADRAKAQDSNLRDKKITLKLEHQPLRTVFWKLTEDYDVPVGFEESTLDRDHDDYDFIPNIRYVPPGGIKVVSGSSAVKSHWFSIDVENQRLEDVLNLIVTQMKNYDWTIDDDVVNIFPKTGRDERYKRLLGLKIKQFTLAKPAPIFMLRTKLLALPEIQKFLIENKIHSADEKGDFNFTGRHLGVDLNFSDITFKDLLNQITRVKRGGWILKKNDIFGSKDKEYIELDL